MARGGAMQEAYRTGKARAIGVSNFQPDPADGHRCFQ
jgi:diketogulonate reductase-like aldo/keto reductase